MTSACFVERWWRMPNEVKGEESALVSESSPVRTKMLLSMRKLFWTLVSGRTRTNRDTAVEQRASSSTALITCDALAIQGIICSEYETLTDCATSIRLRRCENWWEEADVRRKSVFSSLQARTQHLFERQRQFEVSCTRSLQNLHFLAVSLAENLNRIARLCMVCEDRPVTDLGRHVLVQRRYSREREAAHHAAALARYLGCLKLKKLNSNEFWSTQVRGCADNCFSIWWEIARRRASLCPRTCKQWPSFEQQRVNKDCTV